MAYAISICTTKTGKTFQEILKLDTQIELLDFLINVFGTNSDQYTEMIVDINHSSTKSTVRKIKDLNRMWSGKLIYKLKVQEV